MEAGHAAHHPDGQRGERPPVGGRLVRTGLRDAGRAGPLDLRRDRPGGRGAPVAQALT